MKRAVFKKMWFAVFLLGYTVFTVVIFHVDMGSGCILLVALPVLGVLVKVAMDSLIDLHHSMANNVESDRLLKCALLHPSVALYPNEEEEGGWTVHAGSVKMHLRECGSSWLWKTNDGSVLPVRDDVADLLKQQVRVIRERRDYIGGIQKRRIREELEADLIKDKKGGKRDGE